MKNALPDVYGNLLIVRPPVPATCNKAGANYKSEVAHLEYSPRRAYDEWLSICDAILDCGGDAIFAFEAADEPLLDQHELHVDAEGTIAAPGGDRLGHMDGVMTGRVFTANGPWVVADGDELRAVMPHMLPHRLDEASYYRELLTELAELGGYRLSLTDNPHRWEGMADVATVGDRVVLTYAVPGHYDEGIEAKSERSTEKGVRFAADAAGVPESAQLFAELIYPHFHGDTVHFGARPTSGKPVLVQYPAGLWDDGADDIAEALGRERIIAIGKDDAVEQYAGNSRQVAEGVLVPDGVSADFIASIEGLGLRIHRVPLFELFGKAGGGPACATLYMPANLRLPSDAPVRYSVRKSEARARRQRYPERLLVDPGFFAGKSRG